MSFAIPVSGSAGRRGAGRPRHTTIASTLSPRDQILDAAGQLFVTRGFAATSTREIAEKVGIRQASLYYHFAGKDEILGALLDRTLRPTLDQVDQILTLTADDPRPTALYLLALVDINTLATAPHNIGLLARVPDVMASPVATEYVAGRRDLLGAYRDLATAVLDSSRSEALDPDSLGELVLQLVETVISVRASGRAITNTVTRAIAASCLSLCGADTNAVLSAQSVVRDRLDAFANQRRV
ncbi:TetR/AcrR family transcriptional regulator [Nocardioides sp. NPDC051685]|uniref:TetR/AcrR family transcriptional regulator n=1 Tax=Nocardioides sp. NPDC051685 TaxID=3364334 RepID=UPI0037B0AD02